MVPLKTLRFYLLGFALFSFTFTCLQDTNSDRKLPSMADILRSTETEWNTTPHTSDYRFINPPLAYKILSQLDVYKPMKELQIFKNPAKSYLGIKPDDNYCDKHRAYFVEYPESVFEQMNVLHSFGKDTFFAESISTIVNDLHGDLNEKMTKEEAETRIHEIKPETNIIFTKLSLAIFFHLTKHASCLFQEANQIAGQTKLTSKDLVAKSASEYMKKYEDRPQCLTYDKFFPQTWQLSDSVQCKEFFNNLLSPQYKRLKQERKIVYIKKIPGAHRGQGVQPLNSDEELNVRKEYRNGALCGKIKENVLMQHYIHNSLLLHGRKFDFRMYLLIASVNPLIAYYHDGFLRVSLSEYDASSKDKKVLLTNLSLNKQIYDDVSKGFLYGGKTEEELKVAQQWSFERLQTYLLAAGVISDPNWLDNYLRPEFKKAMIHLVRLASDSYSKHSSFYGLYGVDFMLDSNLNLWFIEANSGPALDGYSQPMGKFVSKMITDHFEVIYNVLRSRAKRAIKYVNKLIEEEMAVENSDGEVTIVDLKYQKEIFDHITMNYFEKEFEVSKENGFAKIIDENDVDVYQGLIEESCL